MIKAFTITICAILFCYNVFSQGCTTPGQNPSSAFPVCGTSTFSQTTVPLCAGTRIPSPACGSSLLSDVNPFWYKFTCFQAGTLGFKITPSNLSDDYDWQLYDVTGHLPNEVYSNGSLAIASNWSGEGGVTGASSAGSTVFVCEGYGKPLFSKMADLQVGHNYLLLISHFTNSQSGYSLAFTGGSAVITDTTPPKLKTAEANCGGDILTVKISKNIKCNSITSTGSEFYITPTTASIVSSTGYGCSTKFDSDSLVLNFSGFLNPGNYTLHVKNGSDGNTFLDYCDNSLALTDSINFTVLPKAPTNIDSIFPVKCAPNQIKIVLAKPVLCSTIAADGSDFTISGNYPVTISGAAGNCNGSTTTNEILINFPGPLTKAGTFKITLVTGTDGNTIINECGQETPPGANVSFTIKDTVSAAFTYNINYGCSKDTIRFFHTGTNGVSSWQWNLDENINSTQQNPVGIYSVFNEKTITLKVSNGFCSDSSTQKILLDNFLKADFTVFEDNCPAEPITFTGTAVGKIVKNTWSFGDGGTASIPVPTHTYAIPTRETAYTVRYTVTDSFGCANTATKKINIYNSCLLAVPTAFTPNGDGLNDFLHPLNAIKAEQLEYKIYNRWGQLVFKTNNWKQGWDGKYNGIQQATGTFIWMLHYVNRDTKKVVDLKGTAVLLR